MSQHDGKTEKVEDCLNQFIVSLIEVAEAEKRHRIERQRQEEEWKRQREEREVQQQLIEEENVRRQNFEEEAANWAKANQIRAYVEAVKQRAIRNNKNLDPDSDLGGVDSMGNRVCLFVRSHLKDQAGPTNR
ncbi:hypothetical protein [Trichloromonas sp.]|uniref:hypothetical protein n=1 Tax=Trichloromonas sp. TaxID=3069249 RepID=UPI003D81BF66